MFTACVSCAGPRTGLQFAALSDEKPIWISNRKLASCIAAVRGHVRCLFLYTACNIIVISHRKHKHVSGSVANIVMVGACNQSL